MYLFIYFTNAKVVLFKGSEAFALHGWSPLKDYEKLWTDWLTIICTLAVFRNRTVPGSSSSCGPKLKKCQDTAPLKCSPGRIMNPQMLRVPVQGYYLLCHFSLNDCACGHCMFVWNCMHLVCINPVFFPLCDELNLFLLLLFHNRDVVNTSGTALHIVLLEFMRLLVQTPPHTYPPTKKDFTLWYYHK